MKKRKMTKIIVIILIIVLIYLAAGAILPFASSKQVSKEVQDQSDTQKFYADQTGVDRAAIVEENLDALLERLVMIREAEERVIISTFDIRDGESTRDIFCALYDAAERNVKVDIIVDGFSGLFHMKREPLFYALGSHPNIRIKLYNTPNPLKPWTFNGRMHDKYILSDNRLMLSGGRNMFDYFIGDYPQKSVGYDREVLVYNTADGTDGAKASVIPEIEAYFDEMWQMSVCKTAYDKVPRLKKQKVQDEADGLVRRYENLDKNHPQLSSMTDYESRTVAVNKVSVITNPTHIFNKEPHVWYQMKRLMMDADERILFHTPYAVLSKPMYKDLAEIQEQAVPIDMLINSIAVGDNIMASSDYRKSKSKVLNTNVRLYEFFGEDSSHGKSVLIDSDLSIIGSYNFDMRSTYIDTETMIIIHGDEFGHLLEEKLLYYKDNSLLVDKDGNYVPKEGIDVIKVDKKKDNLLFFLSQVVQFIRFLI